MDDLVDKITVLRQEIVRLKALVETAYKEGYSCGISYSIESVMADFPDKDDYQEQWEWSESNSSVDDPDYGF